MPVPIKHHYLPKFYLKKWATQGQVRQYTRPRGLPYSLATKLKYPGETGYERHLYSLLKEEEPDSQAAIELQFLQKIDGLAAKALAKMLGGGELSSVLRGGWSQFVISLLHRSPHRLQLYKTELDARVRGKRDAELGNVTEIDVDTWDSSIDQFSKELMVDLISPGLMVNALNDMTWHLLNFEESERSFLTSDYPVMFSNSVRKFDGFIIVPVSPNHLFLATHNDVTANAFKTQNRQALVVAMNDAVVKQADHLVISTVTSHLRFVENRLQKYKEARDSDGLIRWNSPLVKPQKLMSKKDAMSSSSILPFRKLQ
ncbi:DUF4238 domain-containing protein [Parasphingorhabdus sp.]|uniref:DUF4238 domain-containing protein n=1 Tax=Parasphingorhabdus sp. TaxID=2709688 RepID=UPI003D2AE877